MDEDLCAALAGHSITMAGLLARRRLVDCYLAYSDEGHSLFVKLLRSDVPKVRRNFGREIAALRFLAGYPGVPRLAAASDDPGLAFHACAFVEAPTLADVIRDKVVPLGPIARALGGVAASLRAVHAAGYAHRDLSPEHILLAGQDAPTILDFGMARFGRGDPRDGVARATDVQALAMMIWEAMSGRPLFAYRGASSPAELIRERAVLYDVLGQDRLGQILMRCFDLQSEWLPHGHTYEGEDRYLETLLRQIESRMYACATHELAHVQM